eukprot:4798622-Prymnesium_polylepis.1
MESGEANAAFNRLSTDGGGALDAFSRCSAHVGAVLAAFKRSSIDAGGVFVAFKRSSTLFEHGVTFSTVNPFSTRPGASCTEFSRFFGAVRIPVTRTSVVLGAASLVTSAAAAEPTKVTLLDVHLSGQTTWSARVARWVWRLLFRFPTPPLPRLLSPADAGLVFLPGRWSHILAQAASVAMSETANLALGTKTGTKCIVDRDGPPRSDCLLAKWLVVRTINLVFGQPCCGDMHSWHLDQATGIAQWQRDEYGTLSIDIVQHHPASGANIATE